jgi:hypothetical protein
MQYLAISSDFAGFGSCLEPGSCLRTGVDRDAGSDPLGNDLRPDFGLLERTALLEYSSCQSLKQFFARLCLLLGTIRAGLKYERCFVFDKKWVRVEPFFPSIRETSGSWGLAHGTHSFLVSIMYNRFLHLSIRFVKNKYSLAAQKSFSVQMSFTCGLI